MKRAVNWLTLRYYSPLQAVAWVVIGNIAASRWSEWTQTLACAGVMAGVTIASGFLRALVHLPYIGRKEVRDLYLNGSITAATAASEAAPHPEPATRPADASTRPHPAP